MLACTLVPPHAKKTSATQGSLRTSPGANESIYVVGWSVLFSFIYFFGHDEERVSGEGFLRPIISKITPVKEKERRKRKSEKEKKEEKRKKQWLHS